jgi:hypothetical protein
MGPFVRKSPLPPSTGGKYLPMSFGGKYDKGKRQRGKIKEKGRKGKEKSGKRREKGSKRVK